ncbi:hypothetical protein GmHk_11G031564 [Glycine max]|nr:hypothetical protein GmHk_11G031564 [Glycine max]
MYTLTVCWIVGFHGVQMSTLALSTLRTSSTSSSTSTISQMAATIFWIYVISHASSGIPQHWTHVNL